MAKEKTSEQLLPDELNEEVPDNEDEGRGAGMGVDDDVLAALSRHSAATITELNISGADGLVCGLDALFDPDAPLRKDGDTPVFVIPRPDEGTSFSVAAAARRKVELGEREPALPNLRILDVSWIRAIDDATLDSLAVEALEIREVSVWGCHRVTDCAKVRTPSRFARLIGREHEPIILSCQRT